MPKKVQKNNFEKDILRLEEISTLLDSEEIGLDEAMVLYEEGINLSKNCLNALTDAELKISVLKKKLDDISADEETAFEE
jgi:exodeoxyribonuclease VII small subunit